jgi:hypothetical protein
MEFVKKADPEYYEDIVKYGDITTNNWRNAFDSSLMRYFAKQLKKMAENKEEVGTATLNQIL